MDKSGGRKVMDEIRSFEKEICSILAILLSTASLTRSSKPPVSELYKLCLGKLTSRWLMGQGLTQAAWVHLLRMPVARNIGFLISEGKAANRWRHWRVFLQNEH
ncbi:hypothetical protein DY000_02053972 [Brassica cretica]|uniref:Uncharacterized protein n=1 Tax=Brassica cretica TaxID=69181 RepID=A0ABQ7AA49_BRACR|nr:hypothetical protein DY000_02053972 [Brassica cretica]